MKKYKLLYNLAKRRLFQLELKAIDRHDDVSLNAIRLCKSALWDACCEVSQIEHSKRSN